MAQRSVILRMRTSLTATFRTKTFPTPISRTAIFPTKIFRMENSQAAKTSELLPYAGPHDPVAVGDVRAERDRSPSRHTIGSTAARHNAPASVENATGANHTERLFD
jgi:hypothetical protein